MITESHLWLSFLDALRGIPRLRWLRLAVAGWHFQVDAVSLVHDHIWDGTSLVLRKGIRRYTGDGQRVLDMGTGHLGLLAVYCARTHNAQVVAVDVNAEFVENARLVAAISQSPQSTSGEATGSRTLMASSTSSSAIALTSLQNKAAPIRTWTSIRKYGTAAGTDWPTFAPYSPMWGDF